MHKSLSLGSARWQKILFGATLLAASHYSHAQTQPFTGIPGYTLQFEYQFGTAAGNNVKSLADLQASFTPDAPWGRINGELQKFVNFLPFPWNNVPSNVTAAARTHQFESEALVLNSNHLGGAYAYGNIESGAVVTNATVFRPVIVEVLAKLPKGRAHWPSIWLYNYHGGHTGDEIDIMESQFNAPVGQRDDRRHVFQNLHGVYSVVQNYLMDVHNRYNTGVDMSADYHYYTCHWWPNGDLDMYVDGNRTIRRNIPWRGGEPNIILYLSTGSDSMDWPGPIVTNSGNGTDTFTPDDPNSTFKIRHVRVFKPSGWPVVAKPLNLALKKPVVASGQESTSTPPVAVNDGNSGTRWAAFGDNQWIYVDLGSTQTIGGVKLNWESFCSGYKIQTSTNASTWSDVFTTTTGNGGIDEITGLNVSCRYVRMLGVTRGTAFGTSLWDFEVYGPAAPNLALNKPTVASSNQTAALLSSQAVDGISSTRWGSSFADNQWIYVDLGQATSISRVKLNWEAHASGYRIQTSNDASTWTTIFTTTIGNGGVDDMTGLAGSGRYVRVYCDTRATGFGISLWDFEVYGVVPPPSANLAQNKPAVASSTQTSSLLPSQAVDGNSATRWGSVFADNQWIYVDLGQTTVFSRVKLKWEAHASGYRIQTSNDASTWTNIYTTTTGNGGIDDLTGLPGSGRYVRVVCDTRATGFGISLWDFEVYP